MWWSHCQWLGRRDPITKSHGNLSFLECAASHLVSIKLMSYFTRSSISSLKCTLLYASSRSTVTEFVPSSGILRRHRMRIWLRFPMCFSYSVSSLLWGKNVSSFLVLSKLPGHNPFHQLSRGVLHCECPFSLLWSYPGLEIGLR